MLMIEVFFTINGERYVTTYKRSEALDMLLKLSERGAVITKLECFEV